MTAAETVADKIVTLASEVTDKTITGSRISGLLQHFYPDFTPADHGCKNLRAFIRKFLAEKLEEAGRSGTDIIYRLPGVADSRPAMQAPSARSSIARGINQEAFRAFKSPNSPLELYANTNSGNLTVTLRGGGLEAPWVRIPPCPSETHLQIAKDFIEQLPDEASRDPLARVLQDKAWWIPFWATARELRLDRRWLSFKDDRLIRELENALAVHSVPIQNETALREAASAPISSAHPKDKQPQPPTQEELRKAILRAIAELPFSELRTIKLPVGDVIDAITKHW
jgi:hypothetical protein